MLKGRAPTEARRLIEEIAGRSYDSSHGRGRLCLMRRALLQLGAEVRERAAEPILLLVGSLAWGFGRRSANWRTRWVPAMLSDYELTNASVTDICSITISAGSVAGFEALIAASPRIPGPGYAFGTKLLYFAGFEVRGPSPRPLILDRKVREGLADACKWPRAYGAARSPEYYSRYLELAERWASGLGIRPDGIEYLLFKDSSSQSC